MKRDYLLKTNHSNIEKNKRKEDWICKIHLHECIILTKGNKTLIHLDLCKKLWKYESMRDNSSWKSIIWICILFVKGFRKDSSCWNVTFIFWFSLCFSWTKDFLFSFKKLTKTQYWIHIYGLPNEYWQLKAIFSITCGIDTLLSLDGYTIYMSHGFFFSRFLVHLNFFIWITYPKFGRKIIICSYGWCRVWKNYLYFVQIVTWLVMIY